ncbi:uncharacterized protein LOC135961889 [Calliphora vicina]|uniref:uncharacterized protein LOC135961889 n=1 Tax=Calliphora vicina TaxID=7373 RepID=UPI00325C311A
MFKLLLLITIAIAAVSAGRLKREEQSTNEALLESGLNIAKDGVKKLEEIASNLISANSTDSLMEQGGAIWDQVKSLASTISKTTQEWSDNTSVKELREIAGSTVQDFKSDHPGLTNAVAGSVESLNKVANEIIVKLKLMVDDKDVKEISNTLIETTSSGINVIKDQLKETTQALTEKLNKDVVKDAADS